MQNNLFNKSKTSHKDPNPEIVDHCRTDKNPSQYPVSKIYQNHLELQNGSKIKEISLKSKKLFKTFKINNNMNLNQKKILKKNNIKMVLTSNKNLLKNNKLNIQSKKLKKKQSKNKINKSRQNRKMTIKIMKKIMRNNNSNRQKSHITQSQSQYQQMMAPVKLFNRKYSNNCNRFI